METPPALRPTFGWLALFSIGLLAPFFGSQIGGMTGYVWGLALALVTLGPCIYWMCLRLVRPHTRAPSTFVAWSAYVPSRPGEKSCQVFLPGDAKAELSGGIEILANFGRSAENFRQICSRASSFF